MFGYPCDYEKPELYWGARAIFESGRWEGSGKKMKYAPSRIDLVHDRQTFVGQDHPRKEDFMEWLNRKGLPAVRKWAEGVSGDSQLKFEYMNLEFVIKASPNASYGYLYIGCWMQGVGQGGVGANSDNGHNLSPA